MDSTSTQEQLIAYVTTGGNQIGMPPGISLYHRVHDEAGWRPAQGSELDEPVTSDASEFRVAMAPGLNTTAAERELGKLGFTPAPSAKWHGSEGIYFLPVQRTI